MHCNVRPMTAADLATTAETWPEQRDEELESVLETLLEVCVLSSHAWTATDLSNRPLAFMGAVPIPGMPDTGHVWLVVLGPEEDERSAVVEAIKVVADKMLVDFRRLENLVRPEDSSAVDLLRRAGFSVDHDEWAGHTDGRHCRVWMEEVCRPDLVH